MVGLTLCKGCHLWRHPGISWVLTEQRDGRDRKGMELATLEGLSLGKQDNRLLSDFFLPFAAGRNPAVPGPCESNKRSDQATALQPAAPS